MSTELACLILTYNEEKNIRRCLESLAGWTKEIFIVDSFSTDKTLKIAREFTDRIFQRAFKLHAEQWKWSFKNLPFSCQWCLALDADQSVPGPLREEIKALLSKGMPDEINGYYINRRQFFQGRWIRFGGYYPKYMLKLFKIKEVFVDDKELVDNRFYVNGKKQRLKHDFNEDNRKEDDILFWLEKHLRYIRLKAEEIVGYRQKKRSWLIRPSLFGDPTQRVFWMTDIYYSLPLYIRPFLHFIWRYFILLGFLDGPQGFFLHFLQGFWYRLMIDVEVSYLKHKRSNKGEG
jgi:glycosyltransferase involved in cell wall biosynthesis